MLSFNLKSKKIPSKAYFKKYSVTPILKNINLMENPTSISHDKICQLIEIQNRYSCNVYESFRNLGLPQPKDKNNLDITELKASGLIELESLRILNLVDSLNYNLDDHTVVLNYLYPEFTNETSNRAAAINYIIERAADHIESNYIKGEIVDSNKLYCKTSKFRNPLKGYRKGYSNDPKCNNTQEIYKDPHSKYLNKPTCYDKRIRTIINKGGVRNITYNNNYNQYIKNKVKSCNQVTNRNPKFYQNSSVSSSSRLARLKYDTLSRTSKTCCGDYKAVPQKDVIGIVKPNTKECKNMTTPSSCYIMINGRKRKKR